VQDAPATQEVLLISKNRNIMAKAIKEVEAVQEEVQATQEVLLITQPLAQAIADYLMKGVFSEVEGLLSALSHSKMATVTTEVEETKE
tara:strand:+ start:883 stop:1146 length:264 start_codon:yes stop_codon:yes gene_type:complete